MVKQVLVRTPTGAHQRSKVTKVTNITEGKPNNNRTQVAVAGLSVHADACSEQPPADFATIAVTSIIIKETEWGVTACCPGKLREEGLGTYAPEGMHELMRR